MYSFLKIIIKCYVQCKKKPRVFCAGYARGRVGSWISGASAYSFTVSLFFSDDISDVSDDISMWQQCFNSDEQFKSQMLAIFFSFLTALSPVGALNVDIPDSNYEKARGDNITLPCTFKPKGTPSLVVISWSAEGLKANDKEVGLLPCVFFLFCFAFFKHWLTVWM